MHGFLLVLQLLAAAHALQQTGANGTGPACPADAPEAFLACLENPRATKILIQKDLHVGDTLSKYAGADAAPLQLARNVTIQGPLNTRPDDRPVLDFGMVDGAVQLCSTCMVTLTRLVIRGERKGSGPVYDVFTGRPGSRAKLRSLDTYRLRSACTPAVTQMKSITTLQRSAQFPNSSAPQEAELRDITYKGKVYRDSVWVTSSTFDVPYKLDEGSRSDGGGYAYMGANSVRLCEGYVSPACLAVMDADACVYQMVDSLRAPQQSAGLAPATAVAIAVPLAVGFLLAAGFAAWWLRRHKQRKAQAGHSSGKGAGSSDAMDSHRAAPLLRSCTATTATTGSGSSQRQGAESRSLGKPLGRTTGWSLLDSQTAPSVGPVQDNAIELGTFLGAGSFGKVFRGRWNGIDVAVKVIEHTGASAAEVQQEMEILMSLQHPNIVRAYHCMAYIHREASANSEYSGSMVSMHSSLIRGTSDSFTVPAAKATPPSSSFASLHSSPAAATAAGAAAAAATTTTSSFTVQRSNSSSLRGSPLQDRGSDRSVPPPVQADAAPTSREGPASCQPASHQHSAQPPATAAGPAAARAGPDAAVRVHFADTDSSSGAAQQAPLAPAHSSALTAGSSGSRLAQAPDSYSSSADGKCMATDLKRVKSSHSQKESSRRFEHWLVLEFCDQGSLSHFLQQWPPPGAEGDGDAMGSMLRVLHLLADAAQGLEELHKKHYVHGDLNARNVLVASCSEAPLGVTGKIGDLGLSRSIKAHQTHRTTNTVGTLSHQSPEMLRSGFMGAAADVYAFGITMWELYTGEDAFQRLQHPGQFFETVVLNDLRPVIPQGMPADYQLLMQHCWATEPAARPSISRVLECLRYMISERQQQQLQDITSGGTHAVSAAQRALVSDPLPELLASPPPRKTQHWWQQQHMQRLALMKMLGSETSASPPVTEAPASQPSSGVLPSFSTPQPHTVLPVEDVRPLDDTGPPPHIAPAAAQAAAAGQPAQPQPPQQQLHPVQEALPPGDLSQPLPTVHGGPSAGSFSFFRSISGRRRGSNDAPYLIGREESVGDRAGSGSGSQRSNSNSSSGRLPAFLQNLGSGLRHGSVTSRDASFDSRGASWSTRREDSQSGGLGDHAWFV